MQVQKENRGMVLRYLIEFNIWPFFFVRISYTLTLDVVTASFTQYLQLQKQTVRFGEENVSCCLESRSDFPVGQSLY
jgi:hypothetical protein